MLYMKDFFIRNKVFIIIILATGILLFGGIFLFTKNGSPTTVGGKVDTALLVPQNVIKTSGFTGGLYLPASNSATVTLVEFGDYECPACGVYNSYVKQILADFSGKINYVFRNFPLTQHKNALVSSSAVEAADYQGKYWQMHDKIYETQDDWANLDNPTNVFVAYAKDLGLNIDKFTADMTSSNVKDKIQADFADGTAIGITETPTFYLNGQKVILSGSYDQLKNLVENVLSSK
jgi:protein-disulfide isomerase